jgi:hypothetical protein
MHGGRALSLRLPQKGIGIATPAAITKRHFAPVDPKQLEYLVHVAELGSFTTAASLLRIAQPARSRQVRSLEPELAQTLLNRNGRGVSPTEAGKRLLAIQDFGFKILRKEPATSGGEARVG